MHSCPASSSPLVNPPHSSKEINKFHLYFPFHIYKGGS
nr:MAG TPA: hypothetical protein [Caudoviricetes sp.]